MANPGTPKNKMLALRMGGGGGGGGPGGFAGQMERNLVVMHFDF